MTEHLISVLTPFYARDPRVPAVRVELGAYLESLRGQAGPCEIVIAGTGPARRDPLGPLLRELAGPEFPHALRTLHHRFDPARATPLPRGAAIAAASEAATGDLLCILHADNRLPPGALAEIRQAAASHRAGCFPKVYDSGDRLLALQAWWLNDWRLRRRRRSVGTNAVWLDRELWARSPRRPWRMLEDVALSDWLLATLGPGGIHVSRRPVTVSAAKYLRTGVLASMAINATVLALYGGGVHPDRLAAELYGRDKLAVGTPYFWPSLIKQAWRVLRD